jgi:hypothetical protein
MTNVIDSAKKLLSVVETTVHQKAYSDENDVQEYTHITLVVDRSHSMFKIKQDMQDGINSLISEQFACDEKLSLTMVEFDTRIDTVVRMSSEPIEYILKPCLATRLFDAVGNEIQQTMTDIAALPESQKPNRVLFVVVTDGDDTHSSEFQIEGLRELIAGCRESKGWDFQFIGVDESAWQGTQIGVNTVQVDRQSVYEMLDKLSLELARARYDKSYALDLRHRLEMGDISQNEVEILVRQLRAKTEAGRQNRRAR